MVGLVAVDSSSNSRGSSWNSSNFIIKISYVMKKKCRRNPKTPYIDTIRSDLNLL